MKVLLISVFVLNMAACKKSSDSGNVGGTGVDGTTTNNFSRLYAKMYNITSFDSSGSANVIIKTTDVPDHKSPFFPVGNAKYEVYNGDNPGDRKSVV